MWPEEKGRRADSSDTFVKWLACYKSVVHCVFGKPWISLFYVWPLVIVRVFEVDEWISIYLHFLDVIGDYEVIDCIIIIIGGYRDNVP